MRVSADGTSNRLRIGLPSVFRQLFQRHDPMAHLHSTRVKNHLPLISNQNSISDCLMFTRQKADTRNASGWRLAGSSSPSGGLFRVETAIKPPARGCTFLEQAI